MKKLILGLLFSSLISSHFACFGAKPEDVVRSLQENPGTVILGALILGLSTVGLETTKVIILDGVKFVKRRTFGLSDGEIAEEILQKIAVKNQRLSVIDATLANPNIDNSAKINLICDRKQLAEAVHNYEKELRRTQPPLLPKELWI